MDILENLKKEIEKTQVVILGGGSPKRMGKIDKPKALLELREGWTLLYNELDFFAKFGFKNFCFSYRSYTRTNRRICR